MNDERHARIVNLENILPSITLIPFVYISNVKQLLSTSDFKQQVRGRRSAQQAFFYICSLTLMAQLVAGTRSRSRNVGCTFIGRKVQHL